MARIDRLSKIKYQYRKPKINIINLTWDEVDFVESAQSLLNGQIDDNIEVLDDSTMPTSFLGTDLDWASGADNDTVVKIRRNDIYVVQDLTEENLGEREFVTTPNLGLGYFGISYYGGVL